MDGQISSIQAIHGTEKGNFDHQMELLLYRPPFVGVKSQMNSRVVQNLLNELFQLHRETGSKWMKIIYKLLYFIQTFWNHPSFSRSYVVVLCSRERPHFTVGICVVFEQKKTELGLRGALVSEHCKVKCWPLRQPRRQLNAMKCTAFHPRMFINFH